MAKKKRSPASNPARGFATTSTPSKLHRTPTPPPPRAPTPPPLPAPPPPEPWEVPGTISELVTTHGPKVRREALRIVAKSETEKRTLRTTCYPLRVERILAHENVGERILALARDEYNATGVSREGEAELVVAWTVQKVLGGMGFNKKEVEQALGCVMKRQGVERKEVESVLEECLEWGALFWEEEGGRFGDGVRKGTGTSTPVPKEKTTVKKENMVANNEKRLLLIPQKDTRHLMNANSVLKPIIQHASLITEISNLELESKDISDYGSGPAVSDDPSSDSSPGEDENEENSDEEEEELTPENLVPTYLALQTKLYNIHPNCASTIVGGKKAKGGGKKPTKSAPRPPPKNLSDKAKATVKRLQQKLLQLERDPLFDSYIADTAWRNERTKFDEEEWARTKSQPPLVAVKKDDDTKPKPPVPPPEDESFMGSLFDGPPTEEQAEEGANVLIRDFQESQESSTTSSFLAKSGKGKAGVGAPAMRKLVQEICKTRDAHSKVRFDIITGTSLSSRSKLTITWSAPPDVDFSPPREIDREDPDVVVVPEDNRTVFEMKRLAAATHDQADGFIVTYALHKLFSKKEEKLYLRLPTVWRNVWAELVEVEKNRLEKEDVKTLERLEELLKVEPNADGDVIREEKSAVMPNGGDQENGEKAKKQKASYEQYLEGEDLREEWERRRTSQPFLTMEAYRRTLPMWAFRQQVLKAVEANPVVVLSGETGCGKSTQLPTFLLENELENGRPCKIYCTQPRRISAISLARRVAEEMGEGRGKVGGLVGYSIRLENMVTDKTRLIYATTGIVMRMLERSTALDDVTHLILDEVHERSIESDFLMVVLKRLLVKRKDLKVVLMSATVDAERFSDYLGGAPVLKVPGRTFPVQEFYLEDAVEATDFTVEDDPRNARSRKNEWEDNDADIDIDDNGDIAGSLQGYRPETRSAIKKLDQYRIPYDLILKLLETVATSPDYADYSKAILVFLPGMGEIRRLNDMILGHPLFGSRGRNNAGDWLIYPLHSSIASEEQEEAFLIPPPGMRKIVLATNIAETGITIPDITAVIDTGKHKEMRFDEKRQLSRLIETFVSKANAKQRRGRAGRVQPGICWHLFTRARYETVMADQQTPEIMRLSLQDLVLRVKICALGNVEEVLTSALDSPTPKNIRRAVDSLVDVKALTQAEELTPLGRQLAKLPLDVYLGKLVLLGSIFGCLDAALTMAALLSSKSPFVSPGGYGGEADRAKLMFKRGDSDLLTGYNAYVTWRRVCNSKGSAYITESEFCRKNCISARTMGGIEDLKGQLTAAVVDAGFLVLPSAERAALNRTRYQYRRTKFFTVPESYNYASGNDEICNAVVAAAFYPKLLTRDGKGWKNVGNSKTVKVHHGSVNKVTDSEWLSYYGIMQAGGRNKTYDAHETSHVDEIGLALLCGDVEWKMFPGIAAVDGNRIRFSFSDWKSMMAVKVLRLRIKEMVNKAWKTPDRELSASQEMWMKIFWEVMEGVRKASGRDEKA